MKTLHEVTNNDALVHRMMRDGMNLKDIICAMSERHDAVSKKLMDLELLAPKRFRFTDGVEAIYRAPADLIPVTKLPGPSTTFENFVKPKREFDTLVLTEPATGKILLRSSFGGKFWEDYIDRRDYRENDTVPLDKHRARANLFFDLQEISL